LACRLALECLSPVPSLLKKIKRSFSIPLRLTDSKLLNTVENSLAAHRAQHIMTLLKQKNLQNKVMCLQLNADNSPQHPLYIGYAKQPVPYVIT
jgi:hypothetical protein